MCCISVIAAFIYLCVLSSSHGLKCHEGVNITLNGIPLYYWTERSCSGDSRCIGQEIAVDVALTGKVLRTALRYGACMSTSYAQYLDCENLFGKDSDFDPAKLLDMIPGIETSISKSAEAFSQNAATSLKQLLSNGKGIESFVNGIFTFYENLGFNLAKAEPLKPSLVKLLTAVIDNKQDANSTATSELVNDVFRLDTGNDDFKLALQTFVGNLGIKQVNESDFSKLMIERMPGLLRSIFPSNWKPDMWYDVAIKLLGHVNRGDWTQSTKDMVATIKSSYSIPADVAQYVNPFLDALPDLVRGSQINPKYPGNWSLNLLKTFSDEDDATRTFSTAMINFIEKVTDEPLQFEYKATIKLMPGLFYNFSPGDKAVIRKVYMEMANAFNSFDFTKPLSAAPETKLARVIKNVISAFTPQNLFNTDTSAGAFYNTLVLNFAKMFYNIVNVTEDYTNYIDMFAQPIEEIKNWPNINVGKMIRGLLNNTGGGMVPPEFAPILDNIQDILTEATTNSFDGEKLVMAFYNVTASYKSLFPNSPFPELANRLISNVHEMLTINYTIAINYTIGKEQPLAKMTELSRQTLKLGVVDLQFAIIKSFDFNSTEIYKMLVKAWPEFDVYIKLMNTMETDDVKHLMENIFEYMSKPPYTTQGFVDATKPTFEKITKSIGNLMSELRYTFSPSSCKFQSCTLDLCNDQKTISSSKQYTKVVSTAKTTTGHGYKVSGSILLNVINLWIVTMFICQ